MMWGFHGYGLGAAGMGLGMILFWGLIIVAVIVLVRGFGAHRSNDDVGPRRKTPLDILRERYASGEIDQSEFQQRKHDLS